MRWQIEYLEEAKKDLKKLDRSAQIIVLKGVDKVSENPFPAQQGGYGKPLGNYCYDQKRNCNNFSSSSSSYQTILIHSVQKL